jgi:hypothetical protein
MSFMGIELETHHVVSYREASKLNKTDPVIPLPSPHVRVSLHLR